MSTVETTTRLMTAEEFCDWVQRPENANRWFELVRGEVIELPAPLKIHGLICFNLARILGNFIFEQGKGYGTGNDSGVILARDPDTVRGPDIAYYEDANTIAEVHPKYGEVPPRLAVEILSSSDRYTRITEKVNDYLNGGVELVWLIEPELRSVTVCRAGRQAQVLKEADELTGEEVLPGFHCRVGDLFLMAGDRPRTQQAPDNTEGKTP
ncbi:MAG: Uma2 family endonuclease [Planctomycetes bacterium]|nr:Uma2 family endonuclease [Planctomycetota bacterium]